MSSVSLGMTAQPQHRRAPRTADESAHGTSACSRSHSLRGRAIRRFTPTPVIDEVVGRRKRGYGHGSNSTGGNDRSSWPRTATTRSHRHRNLLEWLRHVQGYIRPRAALATRVSALRRFARGLLAVRRYDVGSGSRSCPGNQGLVVDTGFPPRAMQDDGLWGCLTPPDQSFPAKTTQKLRSLTASSRPAPLKDQFGILALA